LKHLGKAIFAVLLTLLLAGTGYAAASPDAQATSPATRALTQTATRATTAEPTATHSPVPTQEITLQGEYENLFPMLIRFYVGMGLARSKIASAQLKLFQPGTVDQTINVPLNDTTIRVFGDNATGIYFPWPLSPQTALQPFREYTFQWTVQDTDKKTYKSELLKVEFFDNSRRWLRVEEKPINIYWYGDGLSGILLRQNVLKAYDLLLKNAGVAKEYNFIIYEAGSDSCSTDPLRPGQKIIVAHNDYAVYPCDPNNASALYGARGFTMIQRSGPSFEQLQDQIVAKMAEDSYANLFKTSAAPPPAWFKSGIMQYYGFVGRSNALLLARDQARLDRLLPLDELTVPPVSKTDDFGASVRNWNAQAYMLTLYLSARFGAQTPVNLARAIGNNSKFEDELVKVAGNVTLQQLYTDWKSWLLSTDADAAIRWNLYISKPTPTVTPTETAFPTYPPFTDVPLATSTLLPSRTPAPSRTPTLTNTPRPPGSLNTFTPTAATTAAATP